MLQRAANNACSWWWSSHVRTKQSKWLENAMQDMEEKVHNMVQLIEEDGDSFARRAEMYYKRRPELISAVEESYRSFKALANRYDLLSKELQNANKTISAVCPEQLQFPMDEYDGDSPPPMVNRRTQNNSGNGANIPKAPIENNKLKGLISTASRQIKSRKPVATSKTKVALGKPIVKSGLSKDEALVEINNINKDILSMQTVKEFVKSSYESGLSKYWAIDNQIVELQEKVVKLQDEFDAESVIDDNEARTLMAEAALKSCKESLSVLQEKQEKSTREAEEEFKKIESAKQLLKSIRSECMNEEEGQETSEYEEKTEVLELEDKNEITLDPGSMTVTELAENIDELVNKVISLETEVSSQTVMIITLRNEADDLYMHTKNLENEKESLVNGDSHDLSKRMKEMENKLRRVEGLSKNIENQSSNLQTNFSEVRLCHDHLSEKLSTVKPDEEEAEEAVEIAKSTLSVKQLQKEIEDGGIMADIKRVLTPWRKAVENPSKDVKEIKVDVPNKVEEVIKNAVTITDEKPMEQQESVKGEDVSKEDNQDWEETTDDRETILLKEYTSILLNYKNVKKRLSETQKKEKDIHFDMTVQIRDLKQGILKRDQEIQHLRNKLSHTQESDDGNNNNNSDEEPEGNEGIIRANKDEMDMGEMEMSDIEEKLRVEIDTILDENLGFWLRFSTTFHQVEKFKSEIQDLQDEISKLKDKKRIEGIVTAQHMYEARPIYKHLREIQTELTRWLEESSSLKDELKRRFEALSGIQEEITKELEEEQMRFSSHTAAKLQGEILNMKQENTKVRGELQTGLDHVSLLQVETEKTLMHVKEEFGISGDQPKLQHNLSKAQVPLRAFIFGTKAKKQKNSLFSFMPPRNKFMNPPNRRFHVVKAVTVGLPAMTNH